MSRILKNKSIILREVDQLPKKTNMSYYVKPISYLISINIFCDDWKNFTIESTMTTNVRMNVYRKKRI